MSKEVKTLAITGNKLVDGIIGTLVGLIILGVCLWTAAVYGSPVFWWKIWGGILASIFVGIFAVGLLAGFSLFAAGFILIVDWWYEKVYLLQIIDQKIFLAIIYVPTLLGLIYLVAKGIVPYTDFLEFLKWFVSLLLSVAAGYIIGKFSK